METLEDLARLNLDTSEALWNLAMEMADGDEAAANRFLDTSPVLWALAMDEAEAENEDRWIAQVCGRE